MQHYICDAATVVAALKHADFQPERQSADGVPNPVVRPNNPTSESTYSVGPRRRNSAKARAGNLRLNPRRRAQKDPVSREDRTDDYGDPSRRGNPIPSMPEGIECRPRAIRIDLRARLMRFGNRASQHKPCFCAHCTSTLRLLLHFGCSATPDTVKVVAICNESYSNTSLSPADRLPSRE